MSKHAFDNFPISARAFRACVRVQFSARHGLARSGIPPTEEGAKPETFSLPATISCASLVFKSNIM